MKIKLLLLILAVLFTTRCNEDAGLADIKEEVAHSTFVEDASQPVINMQDNAVTNLKPGPKLVTKKIKIKGSGTIERTPTMGVGICAGYDMLSIAEGVGRMSHFGKFYLYLSYCSEDDYYCDSTTQPEGYHLFANGDKLYTKFLYAVEEDGKYIQYYSYDGGTGKFEGATGNATLYFSFNVHPCPTVFENYGEGEITFYK